MNTDERNGLKKKIARLPRKPGIYFFKAKDGRVIYIGKARSLRERVKSYLASTPDLKVKNLLTETHEIDFLLTDSEKEASFLENNFIQQYQPKFNIKLKDDKAFPFLKITCQEDYPGIYLTRRVEADGARYFGPFHPAHQARKNIHLVNKYFGIRNCREVVPGKRTRPCLEYDLQFCSAPCVGSISNPEYRDRVDSALLFLEGKTDELLNILKNTMRNAAEREDYEHAAQLRDLIFSLEELKDKPKLISVKKENKDIFGISKDSNRVFISVFRMKEGKVIESEIVKAKSSRNGSLEEILSSHLESYYAKRKDIPDKMILPFHPKNEKSMQKSLSRLKGKKLEIIVPVRGENKKLMELATRNAEILPREAKEEREPLIELKNVLGLKTDPHRIEGFDISNTGGEESVGSLVVFEDGKPLNREYKKFKIKTVEGPDDVASLYEVVRRRYASLLTEGREFFPDLILIDGGKAQLGAAQKALRDLGVKEQAVASLAKKEERIFTTGQKKGILLNRTSPALRLLQGVRDEAHRFALAFHRKKRAQRSFSSPLDGIPGIGPRKKTALLQKFGSIQNIKAAPPEELIKILGRRAAQNLKERLA